MKLNLYVVRNKEGKFFRPVGFGGMGEHWQAGLSRAKFYSKIGPAKSQVTFSSKHYPEFGVPDILEITLDPSKAKVIDMASITIKSLEKQASRTAHAAAVKIQQEIDALSEKLAKLKKK